MKKPLISMFGLMWVFILTACSFDGFYNKAIPANVKAMDEQYVAAILNKDIEPFRMFQGDMSDEDFQARFQPWFDSVPDGDLVYKTVVSFESSSQISTSGKSKTIDTTFELQKGEGFLLVNLIYTLDKNEDCCRLVRLNVSDYESSPIKAGLEKAAQIGKIIGLVILGLALAVLLFVISRIRRKRREKAS